jgi:hypothetical protein
MRKWIRILIAALRSALLTRRDLALENLALRQQLAVYKEAHPRPRLTDADRQFWVLLSRIWRELCKRFIPTQDNVAAVLTLLIEPDLF